MWKVPIDRLEIDIDSDMLGRWSHAPRSEEHTSELQSRVDIVCRLLLEKKKGLFAGLERRQITLRESFYILLEDLGQARRPRPSGALEMGQIQKFTLL